MALADKLVLAAGQGSKNLAPGVGLAVPIHPQHGQILVTERLKRFLKYPTIPIRQTKEGSVLLGISHEDVCFGLMQSFRECGVKYVPKLPSGSYRATLKSGIRKAAPHEWFQESKS